MPRNNTLLEKRNKEIYRRYKELYDVNFLRHEKVLEMLANEFYLGERTISVIVFGQKVKPAPIHEKN